MLKVAMKIEERSFKNAVGENIKFVTYEAEIDGETIKFAPKDSDKKLCEFLLKGKDLTPEEE